MTKIAIVGGSGMDHLEGFSGREEVSMSTPYGEHSPGVVRGRIGEVECIFLPRHGNNHRLPPHKINYRANIWLLKSLGVEAIVAVNVVGGIGEQASPQSLVIPEQIIDFTYGREHTFFDGVVRNDPLLAHDGVHHIDFTCPYTPGLRSRLIGFFEQEKIAVVSRGVYACTQGPRLETAAEIEAIKRQGGTLVGMTAMPEAALAREMQMDYCSLCPVVNWAAGVSDEILNIESIMHACKCGIDNIKTFLPPLLNSLK